MATTETRPGDAPRERKVNAFVFDCVCHIFNFDPKNALGPPGQMFDEHLYAFHQLLTREGEKVLSREEFMQEWSVDEIYDMVIEGSDTDMIARSRCRSPTSSTTACRPGRSARRWRRSTPTARSSGAP